MKRIFFHKKRVSRMSNHYRLWWFKKKKDTQILIQEHIFVEKKQKDVVNLLTPHLLHTLDGYVGPTALYILYYCVCVYVCRRHINSNIITDTVLYLNETELPSSNRQILDWMRGEHVHTYFISNSHNQTNKQAITIEYYCKKRNKQNQLNIDYKDGYSLIE